MNRLNDSQRNDIAELFGKIPAISQQIRAVALDITGSGKHQPGHLTQRAVAAAVQLDELYARYKQSVASEAEPEEEPEEKVAGQPLQPMQGTTQTDTTAQNRNPAKKGK